MAIYMDIYNLVINKKAITEKYVGGLDKFKKDYDIPASEINQEDGQLFSLGQMDPDEFDLDKLVLNGLKYDKDLRYSDDFTIIGRYSVDFWEVNWLKHNKVFAWHIASSEKELQLVDEVSNMFVSRIAELIDQGNNPLKTIWIKDL